LADEIAEGEMNEIDLGGIEAAVIARIQAVFAQVNLTGVKVESS
jgi:hypothetical protein